MTKLPVKGMLFEDNDVKGLQIESRMNEFIVCTTKQYNKSCRFCQAHLCSAPTGSPFGATQMITCAVVRGFHKNTNSSITKHIKNSKTIPYIIIQSTNNKKKLL